MQQNQWVLQTPMPLPVPPRGTDYEVMIFEPAIRQKSNYMRDEPKNDPFTDGLIMPENPFFIDCPGLIKLKTTSYVDVKDEKGNYVRKKTRYIKNFHSFWVEDQERAGVQPNYLEDNIYLTKGQLVVTNSEDELTMFNYMKYGYSRNANFDDMGGQTKRSTTKNRVKELNLQLSAVKDVDNFVDKEKAMKYLGTLRKLEGGRTIFNEDKIKFLCSLFQLPSFTSGYTTEAFVALWARIEKDPKEFLSTVGSARALYEADVLQASQMGILHVGEHAAKFSNGKVILTFDSKLSESQRFDKLIDFVANPENQLALEQIRMMLLNIEQKETAVIGG